MLSLEFFGLILDPILQKLMDNEQYPGYADPRHCLVFWVRPPALIRDLVERIQQRLCKSGQRECSLPPKK